MPCGCSGKRSATTAVPTSSSAEWTYIDQSGHEVVRGTEMQAKAAAVRDNYAGKVEPS